LWLSVSINNAAWLSAAMALANASTVLHGAGGNVAYTARATVMIPFVWRCDWKGMARVVVARAVAFVGYLWGR